MGVGKGKIKINKYVVLLCLIELISIICSIINKISCYNALVFWHGIICFIFLYDLNKNKYRNFINIFIYVLALYIVANFIYILCNFSEIRNNINANYIFGKKNMLILYIFPYLYTLLFNNILNEKKKIGFINICTIGISIISIYFSSSSTSIVACCTLILYYFFADFRILKKMLNLIKAKTILIIMILFFILIIVFQIQNNFSYFIEEILGKDLTFTGRTSVWNRAIELIIENPMGYGWDAILTDVPSVLSYIQYAEIGHAHNFILNLTFKSGVVATLFYFIYLISIANRIDNMNNETLKNVMKIGFAVYLILFTFESYPTNCICLIFITYLMSQSNFLYKDERKE